MTANLPDPRLIEKVHSVLESMYPGTYSGLLEPNRGNCLDVLVATILSQATNDTLSGRAFDALKAAYPTWEGVLSADPSEVEKHLAVGGLQREKTKKIRDALSKIKEDFGEITLDSLSELSPKEAFDYLTSLPGVGPKTAACVIGFGLCKPAFPVDTHVLRLSKRLGLVPPKATAEKAQAILSEAVPPHLQMPLHVLMIRHGRETCHSRKPRCESCPLHESCAGVASPAQESTHH